MTGLVVYDTYTQFNALGQAIILLLIQIGGLGFMFVAITFSLFLGRRIITAATDDSDGVGQRNPQIGGIVRLMKKALLVTMILELTGAVILSFPLPYRSSVCGRVSGAAFFILFQPFATRALTFSAESSRSARPDALFR